MPSRTLGRPEIVPGLNGLMLSVVVRAALDARSGDVHAAAWLCDDGMAVLELLGLSADVAGWVRENCATLALPA